jgi:endonuclease I
MGVPHQIRVLIRMLDQPVLYGRCRADRCRGNSCHQAITTTIDHVVPKSLLVAYTYPEKIHEALINIHNLYLCCPKYNSFKGSRSITKCSLSEEGRGPLSRATLYMYEKYLDMTPDDYELLQTYDRQYPPQTFERRRNELIYQFQGHNNHYITAHPPSGLKWWDRPVWS